MTTARPEIINLPPIPSQQEEVTVPFHIWHMPDGEPWTLFHHTDNGFLVRFPGMADFHISMDGKSISVAPVVGTSDVTMQHLLHNQVIPLALSHQGKQLLHASAVMIHGHAVAFLGLSGRGKSSLAAHFATSGHEFLTDDSVMLFADDHGFSMSAGQPTIRLWHDSLECLLQHTPLRHPNLQYTDKSCILADELIRHHTGDARLLAIFCLGDTETDTVSIHRIKGQEAILHLVQNTLVLDVENTQSLQRNFAQLCKLATTVPLYRIEYHRDYSMLPDVRTRITEEVTYLLSVGR